MNKINYCVYLLRIFMYKQDMKKEKFRKFASVLKYLRKKQKIR